MVNWSLTKEVRLYNGEKTQQQSIHLGCWESWTATFKSVKFEHTKVNSKWLKDLNTRHNTGKLLEENVINYTNVFLGQSPKAIEIKAKINKCVLTKCIIFCTEKETINKMKSSLQKGRKYLQTMWLTRA